MGDPTIETSRSDGVPVEPVAHHPPERLFSDLVEAERAARYAWAAALVRDGRVLDVGCGDGSGALTLARAGAAEVVGVEPAQRMLDTIDIAGADTVSLIAAEPAALPFDDDRFDLVLAFGVLDRLDDPPAALAEFARVLAPGGALAVDVVDPAARWHAAVAERFENVLAGRQASRIVTEVWFPAGGRVPSTEEPATTDATHVILLASDAALQAPAGVAVDAGASGWSGWRLALGDLRAENAALRRSIELQRRETLEVVELRTALLDAEQLLAEREDLRADLRDAEADLQELIDHMRRLELDLGRFREAPE